MFERFTESSVKIIILTIEEARKQKTNIIGEEQLLNTLINNYIILDKILKDLNDLEIKELSISGLEIKGLSMLDDDYDIKTDGMIFTSMMGRIIESAIIKADSFSSKFVRPGHIFLSLIDEKGNAIIKLQNLLGKKFDVIKATILKDVLMKEKLISKPKKLEQPVEFNHKEFENLNSKITNNIISTGPGGFARFENRKPSEESLKDKGISKLSEEPLPFISKPNADSNEKKFDISDFTICLNDRARNGLIEPVIGLEKELERVIHILARKSKNNPILLGEPGVGKTAVVEALAIRIAENRVPEFLEGKKILSLDLGSLVAGARYRGEFENRIKNLLEVIKYDNDIILVIDEIHTIIGAGGAEGGLDAANLLKPALARGELQCIGATTLEEYRKHIEKDPAFARRFQQVIVEEPSLRDTIKILQEISIKYAKHHLVKYSDESLAVAAKMSKQYIADRFLPDKAIDLIDEAGARLKIENSSSPDSGSPILKGLKKELKNELNLQYYEANALNYEKAALHRNRVDEIQTLISVLFNNSKLKDSLELSNKQKDIPIVQADDIARIVASLTGIPVNKITKTESEKLLKMEATLHERLIGQHEAVVSVSNAIRRARVGFRDPNRPIASFIFAGPTGVGKTELTKALASYFFGSEETMIRIDMSEYMERHTVAKLIGAPPGYVGYGEGGQLTEAVRSKPYSVVLFDEIEKAHPDVFNLMLQILEDGRLTDSKGKTVNFSNTLIIMTSNAGAKISEDNNYALNPIKNQDIAYKNLSAKVNKELKKAFRPEFLNRLDDVIVFSQLSKDEIRQIADIMVQQLAIRVSQQGVRLYVSDRVRIKLTDEGFDPVYGARPLRRAVTKFLEDSLAQAFLNTEVKPKSKIYIDLNNNKEITVLINS
jgi:ATP-dependent Clp protease ATP-binding subunit ClpC